MVRNLLICLPLCLLMAPAPVAPPGEPALPARPAALADGPLPDRAAMEQLARDQPLRFLEHCLRRYQREVRGYRALLLKHERLAGKLQPEEEIDFSFRDEPYSIFIHWRKGARQAQ